MKPSKQSVSELKRQLETEESNTNYDIEYVNIVLVLHHMKDLLTQTKKKSK